MAISFAFSVIMRSSVQTMQKLATMIAIDRMRNVAIRSSFSALKRFLFISRQSRTRSSGRSTARDHRGRQPVGVLGVVDPHLDRADLARRREVALRLVERRVDVRRVVLVHPAVEDRRDAELARLAA